MWLLVGLMGISKVILVRSIGSKFCGLCVGVIVGWLVCGGRNYWRGFFVVMIGVR